MKSESPRRDEKWPAAPPEAETCPPCGQPLDDEGCTHCKWRRPKQPEQG